MLLWCFGGGERMVPSNVVADAPFMWQHIVWLCVRIQSTSRVCVGVRVWGGSKPQRERERETVFHNGSYLAWMISFFFSSVGWRKHSRVNKTRKHLLKPGKAVGAHSLSRIEDIMDLRPAIHEKCKQNRLKEESKMGERKYKIKYSLSVLHLCHRRQSESNG